MVSQLESNHSLTNAYPYASLLKVYSIYGKRKEAFALFCKLAKEKKISLRAVSALAQILFQYYQADGNADYAYRLFSFLRDEGYTITTEIMNNLIAVCISADQLESALGLFSEVDDKVRMSGC